MFEIGNDSCPLHPLHPVMVVQVVARGRAKWVAHFAKSGFQVDPASLFGFLIGKTMSRVSRLVWPHSALEMRFKSEVAQNFGGLFFWSCELRRWFCSG